MRSGDDETVNRIHVDISTRTICIDRTGWTPGQIWKNGLKNGLMLSLEVLEATMG